MAKMITKYTALNETYPLTSFKASPILIDNSIVKKVILVVDRKELDYQTVKDFNSISTGSVDSTGNTKIFYKQFCDDT